ncbi:hypothetical protein [Hyalangium minutum]|uniref:Uncharacterized protein n=1 Tax=Hyalangium minutum TaxID=394096 RepID=A0A085WL95_9BACT|nr:hypothetical protein [Hyalangium minutum]KFE68458.1 hypothetical protein DB31_7695 [Hyalangium minutum]
MIRKDYIESLIEQFAAAFSALLKLRRERKTGEAQQLLRDTALSLLGMEYSTLTMADAASTARLLGQPLRVVGLARLVAEEAELFQEQGEAARASLRWGLALELFLEARALGASLEGEDARVFAGLRQKVAPALLSERAQGLLAGMTQEA